MKSFVLLILGLFFANLSFSQENSNPPSLDSRIGLGAVMRENGVFPTLSMGQDALPMPSKDIRVGLGAVMFEGLSAEFTLEADMSKRWFVSARFSTLFWTDNLTIYSFRRGIHYKLLNYKRSYFSIGLVYMNARIRSRFAGDVKFKKIHDFELPLNLNVAVNKNLSIAAGIAFNTSSLEYTGLLGKANLLALARLGVKYRIQR